MLLNSTSAAVPFHWNFAQCPNYLFGLMTKTVCLHWIQTENSHRRHRTAASWLSKPWNASRLHQYTSWYQTQKVTMQPLDKCCPFCDATLPDSTPDCSSGVRPALKLCRDKVGLGPRMDPEDKPPRHSTHMIMPFGFLYSVKMSFNPFQPFKKLNVFVATALF